MSIARKFYKLFSLDGVFKHQISEDKDIYNTTTNGFEPEFSAEYTNKIDEHTILFITANSVDDGRYVNICSKELENNSYVVKTIYNHLVKEGDTFIWARGDLYCHSGEYVTNISYNNQTGIVTVQYQSGETLQIPVGSNNLDAIYPLVISDNELSIEGFYYDGNGNVVENVEVGQNDVLNSVNNAHVEGQGNTATINNQHIQGKFAVIDNDSIFIIGGGTSNSNRLNVFTVGFDGKAYAKTDVTAGGTKANPWYKLSDIHKVVDEDWIIIR